MRSDQITIKLGGYGELEVHRARLGLFLELEALAEAAHDAADSSDSGALVHAVASYLALATGTTEEIEVDSLEWVEFFEAYAKIRKLNALDHGLPMLRYPGEADDSPWDYKGRTATAWVHILASNYHWSKAVIENLWPDEAARYVQEIFVQEQLEREWQHSLSPVSYESNGKGKATLRRLPRPQWMLKSGKPKKTLIPKAALPQGTIIDLSGIKPEDLDD